MIDLADITLFVLNRLWELRELDQNEFQGRAEELLHLYVYAQKRYEDLQSVKKNDKQ